MGTTRLIIERYGANRVSFRFSSRNGGATNWTWVVDALGALADELEKQRRPITRPDGSLSLGRGGRVVVKRRTAAVLLRRWLDNDDVATAAKREQLMVENSAFDQALLSKTRAGLAGEDAPRREASRSVRHGPGEEDP